VGTTGGVYAQRSAVVSGGKLTPCLCSASTLTVEGADILSEDALNALHEVGCHDATFGSSNGIQTAEFDRKAPEFAEAVGSAIRAVERAMPGAVVVRIRREVEVAAEG
jgi:hypothetical protein